MIGRQRLFIEDAQYELHCEMGSQYRERLQGGGLGQLGVVGSKIGIGESRGSSAV